MGCVSSRPLSSSPLAGEERDFGCRNDALTSSHLALSQPSSLSSRQSTRIPSRFLPGAGSSCRGSCRTARGRKRASRAVRPTLSLSPSPPPSISSLTLTCAPAHSLQQERRHLVPKLQVCVDDQRARAGGEEAAARGMVSAALRALCPVERAARSSETTHGRSVGGRVRALGNVQLLRLALEREDKERGASAAHLASLRRRVSLRGCARVGGTSELS